jgi:ATP-dependent Lon protease
MNALDRKINEHFAGLVVRKDLVKTVKGNAIVPSYVLEYLLGQYCATDDEDSIQSGINTVREILAKHYVHRNEAGLVRSTIREKGRYKVIDKVEVALNDKKDVYEARFSNLGIKEVLVDADTIKKHPKLLVGGVWCITDLEYEPSEDKSVSPWILGSLKPIQLSRFDFETYLAARKQFTVEEWIDLLLQSIGLNREMFGMRGKLLQLIRLIPFCERNYNLIELGPKGTGKSHVYSEFSPHGILLSGGEVTVPKLFVNNATGKIGLVGYWDCVAFDEFAGKQKRVDKALVDILKNYMANKTFSRGIETLGAEASIAFVGNTDHTVPYMLKHSHLFDPLPDKFCDSAFIDRLHFYIPGWEVETLRGDMFSDGYGFVVDYLAEILRHLRNSDYSDRYQALFSLSDDISVRDRDGIHKTFSGLMKILFPDGQATEEEIELLLRFAIEGRKRVKDQMMRVDTTFAPVHFAYSGADGVEKAVETLEEGEFPDFYHRGRKPKGDSESLGGSGAVPLPVEPSGEAGAASPAPPATPAVAKPQTGSIEIRENQTGISYERLFGPYLRGAKRVDLVDPYIRMFHQARNLMEFLEVIIRQKAPEDEVLVRLQTIQDEERGDQQTELLQSIRANAARAGVDFDWTYDETRTIHDRKIETDTGWKIVLGRGLDIFQAFDNRDAFNLGHRLQEHRRCKACEITVLSAITP